VGRHASNADTIWAFEAPQAGFFLRGQSGLKPPEWVFGFAIFSDFIAILAILRRVVREMGAI
jgi:hypothetical protein